MLRLKRRRQLLEIQLQGIKKMMDWNIRLGDVLVMISLFGSVLVYAFRAGGLTQKIETLSVGLDKLESAYKEMADLLVQVAVQKARLDSQDERLNRLSGWIDECRRQCKVIDR